MYGQVHTNRVLYKKNPDPGHRYRQIVAVELDQFQVRIFEGEVVITDPKFIVDNPYAELYLHNSAGNAMADVEKEFADSISKGWLPHHSD